MMDPLTQPSFTGDGGCRILIEQIDIHQLDLRYAHTRIMPPDSIRSLCASLEQFGQISPLVSVECDRLVLIDGYRRVAAMKRNRQDTALSEIWPCSEQQAILRLMAKSRSWEPVEEAALLRELLKASNLSRARLARLLGKDPSWVTRRLDLLDGLNEELLKLIRSGKLSSWAASRVIVPLARANDAHALRLAQCIAKEAIPTRDLATWFDHYQKSTQLIREKMLEDPLLFLRAVRARADQGKANHLSKGPDGRWLADLASVLATLRRLLRELSVLYGTDLSSIRETLQTLRAVLQSLDGQIERMHSHVESGDQANDPKPPSETDSHSHHQQDP